MVTNGRCSKHGYVEQHKPANPKYLSAAWRGPQGVRTEKLRSNPLCEEHLALGFVVPATCVDHRDGNSENDAWGNLRSLCLSCHSVKTARQDGGFGNAKGRPKQTIGAEEGVTLRRAPGDATGSG